MTNPESVPTPQPAAFQKIAVGVDFSSSARAALSLARQRFPGAQLKLIHVVDARAGAVPDFSTGGSVPVMPDVQVLGELSASDERQLDRLALQGEEEEVVMGDPASTLVEAAQLWGAELLVVGTHAQGVLAHFFEGSVAEAVQRRSKIPVLVVPLGS
ncbi:universal stress protein [Deinococcus sp. KNUC1210]|uniref:universal stress protein n=1 Tax=Deinococcus sp. KNUC1210 TaxID=2917691 RepID=UPI001EF0EE41|nr:universal stress protein [Deinococcus sp. KNUC1210]ULH15374.1 universal stress protein [Deinococcus sp. KNUC1210]